jgi:hypothetical protein
LDESTNSISNSLGSPNGRIIVKTFEADVAYNQDNKLFEMPANIRYKDLQETINKKYNNQPIHISIIDEYEESLTVDSDLVLQKAIQLAIKNSYNQGDKEVTLRLIVHKLPSGKYNHLANQYSLLLML